MAVMGFFTFIGLAVVIWILNDIKTSLKEISDKLDHTDTRGG